MMRALWTGAAGMKAQQTNVDTIANNLANVNTTGYKSQSVQFKSLLYQTLQTETTSANGANKPTTAQVGLGTRVASINTSFTQGQQFSTTNKTGVFINGEGFFQVRGQDGQMYYTRNGDFGWSLNNNGDRMLATNSGLAVMDTNGNPIIMPATVGVDSVSIGTDGAVAYRGPDGNFVQTGQSIALYQFQNLNGLEKQGETMYAVTAASGPAMNEATTVGITRSIMAQGFIEGSNVNVADEMVNMIIAQRAYEMNSKAITTSDTMLEQANNLKR